jgi:hypothetical protein
MSVCPTIIVLFYPVLERSSAVRVRSSKTQQQFLFFKERNAHKKQGALKNFVLKAAYISYLTDSH